MYRLGLRRLRVAGICAALFTSTIGIETIAAERPVVQWGQHPISSGSGESISIGPSGAIYVAGAGTGPTSNHSAFLSRYDDAGNLAWSSYFDSPSGFGARGVSADALGSVYVVGHSADNYAERQLDSYLVKFDESGNRQWTTDLATAAYEQYNAVAADPLGNVFVLGSTNGNLVQPNAGYDDAIIRKYDANGSLLWSKQMGTELGDTFFAADVDSNGNLYVAGHTEASLYSPNANTALCGRCFSNDVIVAKFDNDGHEVWSRQFGAIWADAATGLAVDDAGNIFVAGHTGGKLGDSAIGDTDTFVVKIDSDGQRQWIQQLGTTGVDFSYAIATDQRGAAYVTISSYSFLTTGIPSDYDTSVTKFDSNGIRIWDSVFATEGQDQIHGVAVDAFGGVYVTGLSNRDLFGAGAAYGAFLAKLSQVPEPSAIVLLIVSCIPIIFRRVRCHEDCSNF